uniref:Uncharacterized protein n=1 Tax=Ananas comosus var. bracteatus TaxID=296719 RepID=A0A6V7P4B1_ANACO|nr:unnamed protein product [Ananas comosus var. bracteatus]
MAMSIAVDGSRVLHVRRLRWKFPRQRHRRRRLLSHPDLLGPPQLALPARGGGVGGGDGDAAAPPPPPPPPPPPRAVFVFRFERESTQGDPKTKCESEGSALGKKRGSSFGGYGGVVGSTWGSLVGGIGARAVAAVREEEKQEEEEELVEDELLVVDGIVDRVDDQRIDGHGLGQRRGGNVSSSNETVGRNLPTTALL